MSEGGGEDRTGFWRRRVGDPLVSLLAQGLTPERLALSLALGLVLGLFPIVGATTLLCLAAGFAFRLNHVALQLANHLAYPLQVPLLLAFVRLGEGLVGAPRVSFDPLALARHFQRDASGFLREFGRPGAAQSGQAELGTAHGTRGGYRLPPGRQQGCQAPQADPASRDRRNAVTSALAQTRRRPRSRAASPST